MLEITIRRVLPCMEPRLRAWLQEGNRHAPEVRETFVAGTIRVEKARLVPTGERSCV